MNTSGRSSRKNATKPVPKKKVKQHQQNPNTKVNETKSSSIKANNNNNNKNSINNNNNNVKKDVSEIPSTKKAPVVDVPTTKKSEEPTTKKLERSNSFIERTLSKIYNKLSDSIDNLTKIGTVKETTINETPTANVSSPFKFQRSLTLNSFQLKKNYRKSILENSRLEKLSEEKISESDKARTPSTPPKSPSPVTLRSRSPTTFRQSMPAGSYDNVDFLKPPKLERSDSFISLIKRKISFNESKPPATMNSNWAVSLQNLQQIDNMVSYEGKLALFFCIRLLTQFGQFMSCK
jgi:hypothetical protein